MSPLVKLVYGLWLTNMALQVVLAGVLASRKAWRSFPVFAWYSFFCVFQNVLCYSIRGKLSSYVYVYWATQSVALILGLTVVYELFVRLLAAYPALHGLARSGLRWAIGLLLLGSFSVVVFHAPVEGSRFIAGFLVLEQAIRVAEVGLMAFLFSFSSIFGLHWRQHVFGIAVGLALFTTVDLLGVTVRTHFGVAASQILNLASLLSYGCSLLVWIGYMLVPERITVGAELPKRAQLEQWNQAIMELIHQ